MARGQWTQGSGGGADLDAVTAGAGDVLAGKVIVGVDGEPMTGTIADIKAATYIPGTANQMIAAGQYLAGEQTILGDSNLISENLLYGKQIFGVAGNVRKYGVINTRMWGAGSRYFVGSSSGNYPFISFSPGFTPTSIVATHESYANVTCYKASWGNIVYIDLSNTREFWSNLSFAASSVIIPVPRANANYNVICTGYY